MRKGEFPNGSRTLLAKIDMASPNLNMRDPVMYRILHAEHHRTGNKWCIYPMYDWAHGQSDSLEKVTHSICTLEFENNRPLYDWYIDELGIYHPQQVEFARLNLTYTMMSKRKLLELVRDKHVSGWDDPPKQFFRLAPGREVRFRWAFFVKCEQVVKDPATGEVIELRCTYDPATRGGNAPDGRKVKGTIHWVSAAHALPVEVRLYDHLFAKADPDDVPAGQTYKANLNPRSLEVLNPAYVEPSAKNARPGDR